MKKFILTAALALAALPSFAEKTPSIQDAMLRMLTETKTTQGFTKETVPEADITAILRAGTNAPSVRNSQGWHFSAVTDREILAEIWKDMTPMKPASGPDRGTPGKVQGGGKIDRPKTGSGNMVPGRAGFAEDMAGGPPAVALEGDEPGTSQGNRPAGGPGNSAGIADAPLAIVVSRIDDQGTDGFDAGLACAWMTIAAQSLGYGTKIVTSPLIVLNGKKQAEYQKKLGIPDGMKAEAVLLVGPVSKRVDAASGASTRNPYDNTVSRIR